LNTLAKAPFSRRISETSPGLQVKLLRVLQEREVVPVGGTGVIKVRSARDRGQQLVILRSWSAAGAFGETCFTAECDPVAAATLRERP